jgi:hypothetical protein
MGDEEDLTGFDLQVNSSSRKPVRSWHGFLRALRASVVNFLRGEGMKKDDALVTPPPPTGKIDPDQILIAEFNYTVQTAFQANEDRARVTSFYLVSVGSFLAAILSTQFIANLQPAVYWGFTVLFLFIAVLAVTTILQLIRLRRSWHESILAMNQIKDYYVRSIHNMDLAAAFRWNSKTIPPLEKPNSLSFYLALEVGLFGASAFGAAVYFGLLGLGWVSWGPAVGLGILFFGGEVWIYRRMLNKGGS